MSEQKKNRSGRIIKTKKTDSPKTIVKKAPKAADTIHHQGAKESATRKKKRNVNLSKLCSEMNKMVTDAVDREIIKRFKTIIDTNEEDITKTNLSTLIKEPKTVDVAAFDEGLQAYIKHYLFMRKRDKK